MNTNIWQLDIHRNTRYTLLAILSCATNDGLFDRPVSEVAWMVELSERAVYRHMKKLRDLGVIELVKRGRGKPSIYKIGNLNINQLRPQPLTRVANKDSLIDTSGKIVDRQLTPVANNGSKLPPVANKTPQPLTPVANKPQIPIYIDIEREDKKEKEKEGVGIETPPPSIDTTRMKLLIQQMFDPSGDRVDHILDMLMGKATIEPYSKYNLSTPLDDDMLYTFKQWWGRKGLDQFPKGLDKIAKWVGEWLDEKLRNDAILSGGVM